MVHSDSLLVKKLLWKQGVGCTQTPRLAIDHVSTLISLCGLILQMVPHLSLITSAYDNEGNAIWALKLGLCVAAKWHMI